MPGKATSSCCSQAARLLVEDGEFGVVNSGGEVNGAADGTRTRDPRRDRPVYEEIEKKLNSAVFPGAQGGPLMHVIAAKAVCFKEALEPGFKDYQAQVIRNAKAMAEVFIGRGYDVVSGGTDNHLMLISLVSPRLPG